MSVADRITEAYEDLHPIWKGCLWLAFIGAVAWFAGPPAYHSLKRWRAETQLHQAKQAMDRGLAEEARTRARAALQLDPSLFDGYRVVLASLRALHDPTAVDMAKLLLCHGDSTGPDRLQAFSTLADLAPMATVGAAWGQLGEERRQSPEFAEVFVRRLLDQTHFEEAAAVLAGLPEAYDTAEGAWLGLLRIEMLAQTGAAEDWRRAQELGRLLLETWPELGERVLAQWERLPPDSIDPETQAAARAWAAAQEKIPPEAALAVAWLESARLGESQRQEVRRRLLAAEAPAPGPEIGRWCLRHGGVADVLAQPPLPDPVRQAAWFPVRADALAAAGRWGDLLSHLDSRTDGLDPLDRSLRALHAAAKAGDEPRRILEWNKARDLARAEIARNAFLDLASAANAAGLDREAEEAMVEAFRLGRGRLPVHARLQPLIRRLAERGRGRDLLDLFGALEQLEPTNPMVLVNHAYWGCLYGSYPPDAAIGQMERLRESLPNAVPVRVAEAVAWLAKGMPDKALEAVEVRGIEVDWARAAEAYRAARGTALILTGRSDEARPLLNGLPWGKLVPREANFFHGFLAPHQRGTNALPWLDGLRPVPEPDGAISPPLTADHTGGE